jgi:beta-lactamase family protein
VTAAARPAPPRWHARAAAAVIAAVLLAGCAAAPVESTPAPPVPSTAALGTGPPSRASLQDRVVPLDAGAVLAAVDAAAAAAGGTVGLAVVDARGEPLVTGAAAGDVVPTASLVKLLVVARLLQLGADGAVALTDTDRARMERAIVRSDDAATSLLWDRWNGAALVTDAAARAGLGATAPPAVAGQWGEATTSAGDVAALLAGLRATFGAGPADTLLGWMRATSATAADGFGQTFGLLAGTSGVAAKQGWMCCVGGTRQLHSAGVLPDGTVVVLLGDFPVATSWSRARTALDTAAAAVLGAVG